MPRNRPNTPAILYLIALAGLLAGAAPAARQSGEAPTRVVQFVPPASLPDRVERGACPTPSLAAGYRVDAVRCQAANTIYDPCFTTVRPGHVLCDVDPRTPSSGTLLALTSALPSAEAASGSGTGAWFFELRDGSTCRPLTGTRREIGGILEVYGCRFGSSGDADVVLGDLDSSAPIWTIQKVLLNKKVDPQTVKSLMVAAVRTVWQ